MKKGLVVAALLLVVAVGVYWLTEKPAPPVSDATRTSPTQAEQVPSGGKPPESSESEKKTRPDTEQQAASEQSQPAPAPKGFCERDFGNVAARKADAAELQAAGGLVHIFEREAQLQDPYGCADFYLKHGLAIDAIDPRDDHDPLTGLFFAIKRNDPKMLRFMLDHGANLQKRAGKNDTRAMGYAYYLALNDTRINRNRIIDMLDSALTQRAGSSGGSDSPGTNSTH